MKKKNRQERIFSGTSRRKKSMLQMLYGLICFLMLLGSGMIAEPFFGTPLPKHEAPATICASSLQQDVRGALTTAIRSAKKSVWLTVYSLSDRNIIHALREKAAEGIPVTVVVDAKAAPRAKQLLGVKVKTTLRAGIGLMHLKILVIDEEQIWCGSANMTQDSFYQHHNLVLAMHHPELAKAIIARVKELRGKGPSTKIEPLLFELGGQKGEFWFLPHPKPALERLCGLINSAKKTIKVAMFTWTHPALTEAVIAAHCRGVKVEVCVDRNQATGAGLESAKQLCQAGIPVRTNYGNKLLHHKCVWIDEKLLASGSANWTKAALRSNEDCFVILSPLEEEQIASLHTIWKHLINETTKLDFSTQLQEVEKGMPLEMAAPEYAYLGVAI